MVRRLLVLAVVASVVGPASAAASVVTLSGAELTVVGDPGRNDVGISRDARGVGVADDEAGAVAGPGCANDGPEFVRCAAPLSQRIAIGVDLAGGDDEADVGRLEGATTVGIDGGEGSDRLAGGTGFDVLRGGSGDDFFFDSPGFGVNRGQDLMDGGPGRDLVNYQNRRSPIRVDLRRTSAVQGERGERDVLLGIEDVVGGETPGNVLIGDGRDNRLTFAGAGSSCGRGYDLIQPFDVVRPPDVPFACEQVRVEEEIGIEAAFSGLRRGVLTVRVFSDRPLLGEIVVTGRRGKVLGRADASIRPTPGGIRDVRIRLPTRRRGRLGILLARPELPSQGFVRDFTDRR